MIHSCCVQSPVEGRDLDAGGREAWGPLGTRLCPQDSRKPVGISPSTHCHPEAAPCTPQPDLPRQTEALRAP